MTRRATKVVVFLLLGAIVNVSVAWGCAIGVQRYDHADVGATRYIIHGVNHDGSTGGGVRIRAGVPLRCFVGTRSWNYGAMTDYGIADVSKTLSRTSRPRVLLPMNVVWPGFAINTIFYAAVLWLLFFAPFALRRRLRIRRGLCPACAYPIGTSPVCTECGKALKVKV